MFNFKSFNFYSLSTPRIPTFVVPFWVSGTVASVLLGQTWACVQLARLLWRYHTASQLREQKKGYHMTEWFSTVFSKLFNRFLCNVQCLWEKENMQRISSFFPIRNIILPYKIFTCLEINYACLHLTLDACFSTLGIAWHCSTLRFPVFPRLNCGFVLFRAWQWLYVFLRLQLVNWFNAFLLLFAIGLTLSLWFARF